MTCESYAALALRSMLLSLTLLLGCGAGSKTTVPRVAPSTLQWVEQAEDQERMRQYSKAKLLYLRAKREAPDTFSRAYAGKKYAYALIFWGEYEAAERELKVAIEVMPNDAHAWHNLGHISHKLGNARFAEKALRKSISLANDPRSHIELAAILYQQGRWDEVVSEYEQLLAMDIPKRTRSTLEAFLPKVRKAAKEKAPPPSRRDH